MILKVPPPLAFIITMENVVLFQCGHINVLFVGHGTLGIIKGNGMIQKNEELEQQALEQQQWEEESFQRQMDLYTWDEGGFCDGFARE